MENDSTKNEEVVNIKEGSEVNTEGLVNEVVENRDQKPTPRTRTRSAKVVEQKEINPEVQVGETTPSIEEKGEPMSDSEKDKAKLAKAKKKDKVKKEKQKAKAKDKKAKDKAKARKKKQKAKAKEKAKKAKIKAKKKERAKKKSKNKKKK